MHLQVAACVVTDVACATIKLVFAEILAGLYIQQQSSSQSSSNRFTERVQQNDCWKKKKKKKKKNSVITPAVIIEVHYTQSLPV